MASLGTISGYLPGGYANLVKLDDSRVVSLAQHLKEKDDGGTDTIVGIISGAYDGQVILDDGSIANLSDHVRNPNGRTISTVVVGAYESQAMDNDVIIRLADKVKADAGGSAVVLEEEESSTPTPIE